MRLIIVLNRMIRASERQTKAPERLARTSEASFFPKRQKSKLGASLKPDQGPSEANSGPSEANSGPSEANSGPSRPTQAPPRPTQAPLRPT